MRSDLERCDADAEDLRDGLVVKLLDMLQDDRLPVVRGEAVQRFLDGIGGLSCHRFLLGIPPPGLPDLGDLIDADGRPLRPELVPALVQHDAREPGGELRAEAEVPEAFIGRDKALLGDVVRRLGVTQHPAGDRVNERLVAVHQDRVGIAVAGPALLMISCSSSCREAFIVCLLDETAEKRLQDHFSPS